MNTVKNNERIKKMTVAAVAAAMLCVIAPLSIKIGDIPLSFCTLGIYFIAAFLGPVAGTASVSVYIMLAALGVPVFAGFSGGVGVLASFTGGYIIGYLPLAFISGLSHNKRSSLTAAALMTAGTAVLYLLGTVWYTLMSGTAFIPALMVCVVPFLPGDAVKIAAAVIGTRRIRAK